MSPRGVRGDLRRGKRDAVTATGRKLAEQAPQLMRELLAPHVSAYVDELLHDMRDRGSFSDGEWIPNSAHRTAMQLVPEILKAVGANNTLILAFMDRFGVSDEGELSSLVERGRYAGEANLEASCQRAVDLLRRRMLAEPSYRRTLLWEVFGVREVEQAAQDGAVLARTPTNGHANGHDLTNGHESLP